MKLVAAVKPPKYGKPRTIRTSYGPVKVLEYGFDDGEVKPLFIDLHGGGFVVGWAGMDDAMCHYFHEKTGVKVISIDYPKAPKHPFPAALEACAEVIEYYLKNADSFGIDVENVGIGGHSAGGNLATVICLKAAAAGAQPFRHQIMDYPVCDMSLGLDDRPQIEGSVPHSMMEMFGACYLRNDPLLAKHPLMSPVYADPDLLVKLPPALLILAGKDSLHDEGFRYGQLLQSCGVPVEIVEFPDSVHGVTTFKGADAKEGWKVMADFISAHGQRRG